MELTRRNALTLLAAAAAAPLLPVLERTGILPPRVVEAVRDRSRRVRVRPLDPRHVARPARWLG